MKSVCYSATEKKNFKTYVTLFRFLKKATAPFGIKLNPSFHMIDIETTAAKASKKVFNTTNISYCHFHFAKAIWRNLQKFSKFNYLYFFVLQYLRW